MSNRHRRQSSRTKSTSNQQTSSDRSEEVTSTTIILPESSDIETETIVDPIVSLPTINVNSKQIVSLVSENHHGDDHSNASSVIVAASTVTLSAVAAATATTSRGETTTLLSVVPISIARSPNSLITTASGQRINTLSEDSSTEISIINQSTCVDNSSRESHCSPIHKEITKALALNIKEPGKIGINNSSSSSSKSTTGGDGRPGPSGLTNVRSAQNNSFAAADSNSGNTPSKSFVVCKVCGDKASGYHYGVTSCEGCKGFFRRSIQKQIEYKCLRDGKCLVIRLNRNRCQYCRFKKCLAVGMSRDSVRYGRVPKRSREKGEDNRVITSEADQSAKDLENMQLAMYEIILTISQAHHAHCAYTEEKTRGLMRKPAIFSLDEYNSSHSECSPSSVTADSLEQQKINMWQRFADFITPSISRVVEFAKRIPGFLELSQDDQLILIKSGFFEIWLVHVSRMVNSLDNTLTFSDGNYITRQQMELMFDHDFVSSIFNFMLSFNNLQMNDTEIGIYAAVVLLQSERYGIYDPKAIHRIQEKLLEALKLQIARHHSNDTQIYPTLMMKLPELRSLGAKHAEHLSWFRGNWTRLKLPPLFAEIFDIPKSEEELLLVAQ